MMNLTNVRMTGEDYFISRSRRLSLAFMTALGACLVVLIPLFFFLLKNVPAGAGAICGLVINLVCLLLVLKGKQKAGNALFFITDIVIILAIAFMNRGAGDGLFPVVLISVVSMTLILIIPTGILVSPKFSAFLSVFAMVSLSVIIGTSGDSMIAKRIPLFVIVYLFGGSIVYVVSRIQNELLSLSAADGKRSAEDLDRIRRLVHDVTELRKRLGEAQGSIDTELLGVEDVLHAYESRIASLDSESVRLKNELANSGAGFTKLDDSVGIITGEVSRQSDLIVKSAGEQKHLVESMQSIREKVSSAEQANRELEEAARRGREDVASVVASISQFSEYQEKLSGINKTIMKIAAQTNMLAMNASIEAAHAGSYGRGFAVVADEVRSLSDESNVRTKEISSIINTMGKMIGESIVLADRAGTSLNSIAGKIQYVAPIIREVYGTLHDYMEKLSSMFQDTTVLVSISGNLDGTAKNQEEIFTGYRKTFELLKNCTGEIVREISELAEYSRKALSIFQKMDGIRRENAELNGRIEELLGSSASFQD